MNAAPNHNPTPARWSLKIVRGLTVGRVLPLTDGDLTLGSAPGTKASIDLADQEGNSPRKMEARHASLTCSKDTLTIKDLESPGGTFVNRKRLLSQQTCRLAPGDVIQLGAVQLEVVAMPLSKPEPKPARPAPQPAKPSQPSRLPAPFPIKAGGTCRSWDDFLAQAAQRWPALVEELSSGRLTEYLRQVERPDLLPRPVTGRSLDDQLDDWLARLPTSHSSEPELDVHPASLEVRQASAGGTVERSLRLTNVGYRLLKGAVRFETTGDTWLRLATGKNGQSFSVIDELELKVEIDLPESWSQPRAGTLIIETNGGNRRIPVTLERAATMPDTAVGIEHEDPGHWENPYEFNLLTHITPLNRIAAGAIGAALLRLITLFGRFALPPGFGSPETDANLNPIVALFWEIGLIFAAVVAVRRKRLRELPVLGYAASVLSMIAAAIMFATTRTVEPLFGSFASSTAGKVAIWAALGAALGLLSLVITPFKPRDREAVP